jgi:beta-N-acetylhexosaminidase
MKNVWWVVLMLTLWIKTAECAPIDASPSHQWADSIYHSLTTEGLVGQLIDLRVAPEFSNIDTLQKLITAHHIGFITVVGGDAVATVRLLKNLQKSADVPVFVTCENDDGLNLPFRQKLQLPSPATLSKTGDSALLCEMLDLLAETYTDFGFHSHTYNPMQLAISTKKLEVVRQNDLADQCFACTGKGYQWKDLASTTNLHITGSWQELIGSDTPGTPFVDSKNPSTKVLFERWTQTNTPQSVVTIKSIPLSEDKAPGYLKKDLSNLLRTDLRFTGLLALDYDAALLQYPEEDDADHPGKFIQMGVDKIITSSGVGQMCNWLLSDLQNRVVTNSSLVEKVKKILRFKYQSGLHEKQVLVYENHIERKLENPQLDKVSFLAYRAAAEVVPGQHRVLPLSGVGDGTFASLSLGFSLTDTFEEALDNYAPFVRFKIPYPVADPFAISRVFERLKLFDHVVIILHTNDLFSFGQPILQMINTLNDHSKLVVVFFGKGIDVDELEGIDRLLMHEDNQMTQRIAACKVFGADMADSGLLTYGTPEMQGMDSRTLERIDAIVEEAIGMGAAPGCQIIVARNGTVVREEGYGHYTYDSLRPVSPGTIYDLASVTKVAATTQAVMKLVETGHIHLDSALSSYLPELKGSNKERLIIRDVLSHHSGLLAFYPFWIFTVKEDEKRAFYYRSRKDSTYANMVAPGMFASESLKDSLWQWTVKTRLRRKPRGEKQHGYNYSDLGFYLLQKLTDQCSGMSLDRLMDSLFFKPMGMGTMTFNPLCKFPYQRIAPTENDENFRLQQLCGTVHDEIAAMKGGVAGHAGLFSNAHDVAKILQMQLQGGRYGKKQLLASEVVDEFTSYCSACSRRGLGWDKVQKKEDEPNPGSRYASFESFGHLGFTGTVAWADPKFNLIIVFLSNRLYPEATNSRLADFNIRKRIQDVVYESIWNFEKQHY